MELGRARDGRRIKCQKNKNLSKEFEVDQFAGINGKIIRAWRRTTVITKKKRIAAKMRTTFIKQVTGEFQNPIQINRRLLQQSI